MNVPTWIFAGFQQEDRQDSQNSNDYTLYRPPVTSAQCIIGKEKYPDAAILLNYDDFDLFQGYGQIRETFRAPTKDDILEPYKSGHDFRSTGDNDAGEDDNTVGCNEYVFDTRYF